MPRKSWMALAALALACRTVAPPAGFQWSSYGGDPGGSRYVPFRQITPANVPELKIAWTYRTGESAETGSAWRKAAFEATPIFVDGVLYLSTPFNRVIALEAKTGCEKWRFDPRVNADANYSEVTSRGVSTWIDSAARPEASCRRRIYVGTIDARLIALDTATGAPCADFGSAGTVDLSRGIERYRAGDFQVTSPPAVIRDLVIVGSSIGDNGAAELERGVVRAYDARTGSLRWSWDPISDTSGEVRTGAANAWAPISVDEERGFVFVPTSSPSPDYYGGERLGTNEWANSIVALRGDDGSLAWSFQVVHHDLWDYDIASQPLLVNLRKDGRSVPAVLVGTKMGHVFVLDRETGRPLFPVEERAVPPTDVPGEQGSPTQPFPLRPAALVPQTLGDEDAWGITPQDREWCRQQIASLRSEGIFTPPSLRGSIVVPGNIGGVHWGGMSFDPVRQLLLVGTNRLPFVVRLIARERFADERRAAGDRVRGEFAPQRGTPYGMFREPLLAPSGAPCSAPPWGALTAIDLTNGERRWEVPLGLIPAMKDAPGSERFGSLNLGGSLVTETGLVFIAAGMDEKIRAFEVESGREVWSAELPASAQATPMSYVVEGRQFVVIAAGGHGKMQTKRGDFVVAFALPTAPK